ncbi:MAG TPA: hypothetical protein VGP19_05900 [Candidatus Acidoferrales bacterium]|jgi:hypothetical protein|nr:hypothetical protein [Candidatus Acidoferrales bacterium]
MSKKRLHVKHLPALFLALTLSFFLGTTGRAQSTPAPDNRQVQDSDTTRKELARFDQFLDGHREIAEQLRKDPSLVNNKDFVKNHPALQTYLQDHPGIREEIKENPNAFLRQEDRIDRHEEARDNDTSRRNLARFDQFLDGHREIAEQLRKDPSLVNNREFVKSHPALQTYLQENPGVREEIKENPNAFLRQEDRFDRPEEARDTDTARRDNDASRPGDSARGDNDARRDDAARRDDTSRTDNDATRKDMARFDRFADSHREIAEQLRKDPSLVNNKEFVDKHPALQAFLQEQPGVREDLMQNPNAFMRSEDRFDRREDQRGNDTTRGHWASFGEFLGGHSDVARQVSKDPSLVNDENYVRNHPELQEYFNAHPGAQEEMKQNPQSFITSAQQFSNANSAGTAKTPAPAMTPDPKQPKP